MPSAARLPEAETTRWLLAEKIRAALAAYMTLEWPEFCPPKLRAALLEVDCGEIAGAMLAEKIPSPPPRAKFDLGSLVLTPGAAAELRPLDMFVALLQYARGDWGELGEREREAIERHIEDCPRCESRLEALSTRPAPDWPRPPCVPPPPSIPGFDIHARLGVGPPQDPVAFPSTTPNSVCVR